MEIEMTGFIIGALAILVALIALAAFKPEWFGKIVAFIGVIAAGILALWEKMPWVDAPPGVM